VCEVKGLRKVGKGENDYGKRRMVEEEKGAVDGEGGIRRDRK
jgi:hypothetical protein